MAYGVKGPSNDNSDEAEPSTADDPKGPSNNNSEEANPLGQALGWIGLGCLILAVLIGQRECYVYFTCAEQETQFLALMVIGFVLLALAAFSGKKSS